MKFYPFYYKKNHNQKDYEKHVELTKKVNKKLQEIGFFQQNQFITQEEFDESIGLNYQDYLEFVIKYHGSNPDKILK